MGVVNVLVGAGAAGPARRRPRGFLLAVLLGSALFGAGPVTAASGTVRVTEDGAEILAFTLRDAERFTLSWVHSVEREAWEETFELTEDGAIRLVSTRFKTFGAGVPSEGGTVRLEDGWVVMEGIDRVVDPLAVLATPNQDYRLRWREDEIDLAPNGRARLLEFSAAADE